MCEETQYLCRYISFCLTEHHDNSCNTITFTNIFLYFLLQQQFLDNIYKAGVKFNIFIMFHKFYLFWFLNLKWWLSFMCLTEIRNKFHEKVPLTYTVCMSSKIHHLQYILATQRGSYSQSVYSYIQNRLVSSFM
jgi:hypothetical protein